MRCDMCNWVWPDDAVSCGNCGRVFKENNNYSLIGNQSNCEYNMNNANNQYMGNIAYGSNGGNIQYGQNGNYMGNNQYSNNNEYPRKKGISKGAIFGIIVIALIIAFFVIDDYMYKQEVIDYVKEYKSQDAIYSVGKFFDFFECDKDWEYEEKEDGEYVSVKFDYYGDSYEIIFKIGRKNVDSSPLILSEVLLNGKEDVDTYIEFYFRIFGE